jgi:hypothetical protein
MPFPKNSTAKTSTPFKPTTHTPKVNANPKVAPVQLKVVTSVAAATTTSSPPVSQSNEENVRPVQADEQATKLEPLSPLPLFGTGTAKAQERDVRAYEHERQRSKRAGEWAIRRAKKTGTGKGKGGAAAAAGGRTADMGDPRRGKRTVDVAVDAVLATAPGARGFSSVLAPPKKSSILSTNAHSDPSRKVNLSDLVVLSQRKPRKLREGDFELVPALPTVIVLDDMPVLDMAVDEPWECVDEEDACHDVVDKEVSKNAQAKKGEQNPSYAKVLVGA